MKYLSEIISDGFKIDIKRMSDNKFRLFVHGRFSKYRFEGTSIKEVIKTAYINMYQTF